MTHTEGVDVLTRYTSGVLTSLFFFFFKKGLLTSSSNCLRELLLTTDVACRSSQADINAILALHWNATFQPGSKTSFGSKWSALVWMKKNFLKETVKPQNSQLGTIHCQKHDYECAFFFLICVHLQVRVWKIHGLFLVTFLPTLVTFLGPIFSFLPGSAGPCSSPAKQLLLPWLLSLPSIAWVRAFHQLSVWSVKALY